MHFPKAVLAGEPSGALELNTIEAPLQAPVGTPSPLREAYEDVADALFQAAEVRREPPTSLWAFEDSARRLSDAYRKAMLESYPAAESLLLAVTDDSVRCAHKEALDAVRAVNAAVGNIMLHNGCLQRRAGEEFPEGLVHGKDAAALVRTVPPFDATALLKAVRKQTCLAAAQIAVQGDSQGGAGNAKQRPARHSPDFRSVHWFGRDYTFTEIQARIVGQLWAAWENGTPDIGHRTLLANAQSDRDRLQDSFKDKGKPHPAWGTMIVTSTTTKGSCRLQPPV